MIAWPNHAEAWNEWRGAMAGSRMHHGWLLAGKSGLGKHDFALAAARELVAEDGVQQPVTDHPDIIVLTHLPKDEKEEKKREEGKPYQTKRNISVGQIREMQRRLTTRPTLGSRRAIIIDPADDMEKGASNALLKSLEEPPQGSFFLLISHRPARLLPTIRSRCRVLRFPTIDRSDLERMVGEHAPSARAEARSAALGAAEGSFGAAMRFVEQDLGAIAPIMQKLVSAGDPVLALRGDLTRAIGARPDRARLEAVIDLAQAIVAENARQSSPGGLQSRRLVDLHGELVRLAAQIPTYNFDMGLLVMEIGTLLSSVGAGSDHPHA